MKRKRKLHKPGINTTFALKAISAEMKKAQNVSNFNVHTAQIRQWIKSLMASAEVASV